MPISERRLRQAAKHRLKHKGLRGSNTPKESQDFVTGLGDAVDSGPDGGNVPTGGGYGEGANMKQVEKASTKEIITKKVIPYLEKTTGQEYVAYKDKLTQEWYPRPKPNTMKNKVKVKQPLKGPKGQETAKSLSGSDLEWWKGLSKERQGAYIQEHPNSKYAKHSGSKGKGDSGMGKWSDHTKGMKAKKDKPDKKAKSGKSHNISIFSRLSNSVEARLETAAPAKKDSQGREFILFKSPSMLQLGLDGEREPVQGSYEKKLRKALDKNVVPFAGVSIGTIFFERNGDYKLYGPFYFYGKDKQVFAWNGVDTENPNGFKLKVYKPLPDFLKKLPKSHILKP